MIFAPNIVPGSGFCLFMVLRKRSEIDSRGNSVISYEKTGQSFYGILSVASSRAYSQLEAEQGLQSGHTAHHIVIQHGAVVKAKSTDILLTEDGRTFYVEAIESPLGISSTMIYDVEERFDIKWEC